MTRPQDGDSAPGRGGAGSKDGVKTVRQVHKGGSDHGAAGRQKSEGEDTCDGPPTRGVPLASGAVAGGGLQENITLLQTQLGRKNQALAMYKTKEHQYATKVDSLQKKAQDLVTVLQDKDSQIAKLKHYQDAHLKQIDKLKCDLETKSRRRPGLGEHPTNRVLTQRPLQAALTLPARLPSIARGLDKETELTHAKKSFPKAISLPPIGAAAAPPRGKDEAIPCSMAEKWVGDNGGRLVLSNTEVTIPPQSVQGKQVCITATEVYDTDKMAEDFRLYGLEKYLQPAARIVLQPHGMTFSRPVQVFIRNIRSSPGRVLVLHKNVDHYAPTDWSDITGNSDVKTHKDGIVFSVDHFSIFEVLKVLAPVATLAAGVGFAAGVAVERLRKASVSHHVLAVLNGRGAECNVSVYHDPSRKTLSVMLTTSSRSTSDIEKLALKHGLSKHVKTQPTLALCEGETLFFVYDEHAQWNQSCVFDLQQVKDVGQVVHLPLDLYHPSRLPRNLTVRRRLADHIQDLDVCFVDLVSALQKKDKTKEKVRTPGVNALRKMRPKLVQDVDVNYLMDHMIQERVIDDEERQIVQSKGTRQAQTRHLLDLLSSKGDKGVFVLVRSLDQTYGFLANELREHISHIPLVDKL